MRAERDEELRPIRTKPERRLAYEIALGIIIGGATLWVMEIIANIITVQLALNQFRVHFGG